VGGHNASQTGLAAQTAGTVFVYGWKISYTNTITDFGGSLRIPGTLTCSGLTIPTPAYIRTQLSTTSVAASTTQSFSFTSATNSIITLLASPSPTISIPAIGVYVISGKIGMTTAINTYSNVNIITSVNSGSTYTPIYSSQVPAIVAGSDISINAFVFATTVVNQYFQLQFVNGVVGVLNFNTLATQSFFNIYRIA
jgi:hypothetical protein